jgi:hypothetical protein
VGPWRGRVKCCDAAWCFVRGSGCCVQHVRSVTAKENTKILKIAITLHFTNLFTCSAPVATPIPEPGTSTGCLTHRFYLSSHSQITTPIIPLPLSSDATFKLLPSEPCPLHLMSLPFLRDSALRKITRSCSLDFWWSRSQQIIKPTNGRARFGAFRAEIFRLVPAVPMGKRGPACFVNSYSTSLVSLVSFAALCLFGGIVLIRGFGEV